MIQYAVVTVRGVGTGRESWDGVPAVVLPQGTNLQNGLNRLTQDTWELVAATSAAVDMPRGPQTETTRLFLKRETDN